MSSIIPVVHGRCDNKESSAASSSSSAASPSAITPSIEIKEKRIKLYACYTPSHLELLCKWFIPSIRDDFEIVLQRNIQECTTGNYNSNGWLTSILKKITMIINAIKSNWGDVIIISDVDIQFFRSCKEFLLKAIADYDLIIQRDNPEGVACTGFFVCRCNPPNLNLWVEIKRRLTDEEYLKRHIFIDGDQTEFNRIVREEKSLPLKWDYLPSSFLSGGTLTNRFWYPGMSLIIPEDIYLHHGNWTRGGIVDKLKELAYVKEEVDKRHAS